MIKYNKNSKLIHLAFFGLIFALLVLTICFMTQYKNLFLFKSAVESMGFTQSAVEYNNSNNDFWKNFVNATATNPVIKDFFVGLGYQTGSLSVLFNDSCEVIYAYYLSLQKVNGLLFDLTIVSAIAVAIMFVFSNESRRIFYKSNLIVGVAVPAVIAVFAIYVAIENTLLIGGLNENLDLLRAMDFSVTNPVNSHLIKDISLVIDNNNINAATIIVVDIFLASLVAYCVFMALYAVKRYNVCAEERKEIIERAVSSHE